MDVAGINLFLDWPSRSSEQPSLPVPWWLPWSWCMIAIHLAEDILKDPKVFSLFRPLLDEMLLLNTAWLIHGFMTAMCRRSLSDASTNSGGDGAVQVHANKSTLASVFGLRSSQRLAWSSCHSFKLDCLGPSFGLAW
eukprot:2927805-Amphidinium_carterae.3